MKKIIFSLILFISGVLLPQSDFVKQITNYNYDSRNPAVLVQPRFWFFPGEFVFEIQEGSQTNVGLIEYINESDSFSNPIRITDDNSRNINPSVSLKFIDSHISLFQTDRNGNWDIAISKEEGGNWGEPEILTNSVDDETNPVFLFDKSDYVLDTLWILYEKSQSIHLLSYKQGVTADRIIFQAHDTISYSGVTGLYDSPMLFVVVERSPSQQKIVYREFDNVYGILFPVSVIVSAGSPDSPKFFDSFENTILTYTAKQTNGYRNIYYSWEGLYNPIPWVDEPTGDLSSLSLSTYPIITESRLGTADPNTYFLTRNDSTFIRLNYEEYNPFLLDTLFFVRVDDASSDIGLMGEMVPYLVLYTIFEDSADGHINLFARKELVSVGKINERIKPDIKFVLFQNYPNPFNPSTRLSFVVGKSSFVTLKVYDLLGKEVTILVNEEKSPGRYNVDFNASGLSSGIYYFKLKAGNFVETKKMVLVK